MMLPNLTKELEQNLMKAFMESNQIDLLPEGDKKAIDQTIKVFWKSAIRSAGLSFLDVLVRIQFWDYAYKHRYTCDYYLMCSNDRMLGSEELAHGLYLRDRAPTKKERVAFLVIKEKIQAYIDML